MYDFNKKLASFVAGWMLTVLTIVGAIKVVTTIIRYEIPEILPERVMIIVIIIFLVVPILGGILGVRIYNKEQERLDSIRK